MPIRTALVSIHLVALALWLAVVIGSGAAAAVLFPTMRDLDPHLAAFAAYEGPHWRLAAGRVAATLFSLADRAQVPLAVLALVGAAPLLLAVRKRRVAACVSAAALAVALASLVFQLTVLRPRMDAALEHYWRAAEAGDTTLAREHADAFAQDHPVASRSRSTCAGALLIALVASSVFATASRPAAEPQAGGGGRLA